MHADRCARPHRFSHRARPGVHQLGHVDSVWEPFFVVVHVQGVMNGTETIITSDVSKAWPIADGALGAIVYTLELAMTWMAGKDRWRTMPWTALGLATPILPLGIVNIISSSFSRSLCGTWCTLCLIAALAMAVMIPYSLNEFVAMGQFLAWSRKQGMPFPMQPARPSQELAHRDELVQ